MVSAKKKAASDLSETRNARARQFGQSSELKTVSDDGIVLCGILGDIQSAALSAHESMEGGGHVPLRDFESGILGPKRRSYPEDLAFVFWSFLLFTHARFALQSQFQNEVSKLLPNAETALVARQLRSRAPRIWSYRRTYDKGFAHTVAGPLKTNEIALRNCIFVDGKVPEDEHLYVFGWTLPFRDKIYLICADHLTREQAYKAEGIHPFPLQSDDDDFWEESFLSIIEAIYPVRSCVETEPNIVSKRTDYAPERRFAKLQRLLVSELSMNVVRKNPPLPEFVAVSSSDEIVSHVEQLVKEVEKSDPEAGRVLCRRVLSAVGCDGSGLMPHARSAIVSADPLALLGLPDDSPIFSTHSCRDSIRLALQTEAQTGDHAVADAFKIYRRERRWLAAFPCFDFNCEEHAARFGIPCDSLRRIFDERLFSARLPIVPRGDALRQLQNRFGFYLADAEPPMFSDVLEAFCSRHFVRGGNMTSIVQWIFSCGERYRYCLSQITPDTALNARTISRSNCALLQNGLSRLADMFAKK